MVKNFITTFLLAAFCLQFFSRSFIIADYYLDTTAYAKNCENKARPKMHCNGKCQMMKKIAAQEKKDAETPEQKPGNKNLVTLFPGSAYGIPADPLFTLLITQNLRAKSSGVTVDRSYFVFHPPRA